MLGKFVGIAGSVLMASSALSALQAADLGTPTEIPARFMFVPGGFDNNDQVQVTLDGYLPNACYKISGTRVKFDPNTRHYTVTTIANKFEADDIVCGQYQVPYTVTANIGQVPDGDYTIETLGGIQKNLHVKQASSIGPDDYLYAPVDHVHVSTNLRRKEIIGSIEGRFTNSCMTWKEIKVQDEGENIVLLPIIQIADRSDCREQEMTYKTMQVKIPWRQPGRYLLHVRGLSGAAINHVFEVDAVR